MDIIKHGEVYAYAETAEIMSKSDVEKYYINKQIKNFNAITQEALHIGVDPQNKMTSIRNRESEVSNVKEKYKFLKIFNVELQKLISEKFFDKNEFIIIGALTPFIQFPYNDVVVKGEYLTFEQLGEMCYLSKNIIGKTLKSLQHKEIIHIVQAAKRPPVIYFNPFLYSCGLVHNNTVDMFKFGIFNPNK